MQRENRNRVQRRKQILFLSAAVLAAAAGVGGLLMTYGGKQTAPADTAGYEAGAGEDVILYDGKKYRYNDHLSNFLFLGIDTRDKVESYETQADAGQADAIFLLSMDRAEKTLRCLVIPRDTITEIETFNPSGKSLGMTKDHINLQYAFGDGRTKSCELMKTAVSNLLYQLPIQGYCAMNMDGIQVATGLVGGVELTVPDDSLAGVNPEFQKGAKVKITEENAEQFVRYRDIGQSQSAIVRSDRQKVFLQAFLGKVQQESKKDASLITTLYNGVQDYMVTNMGNDLFVKILEASNQGMPEVETLPGEGVQGESFDEYHIDEDQLYELILKTFYKEAKS